MFQRNGNFMLMTKGHKEMETYCLSLGAKSHAKTSQLGLSFALLPSWEPMALGGQNCRGPMLQA